MNRLKPIDLMPENLLTKINRVLLVLSWKKAPKRLLIMLPLILLVSACGSRKEVVYFQNAKDFETQVMTDSFNPRFKVNDILSIHISVMDMEVAQPFNLYKASGDEGRPAQEVDYLIDKEGNIDFPVLGKMRMLGLTVQEAKELFAEKLKPFLKNPIVNIRIKNFSVSVLGEVNRPGRYEVSGERVTILQALAMAGDLTIKGVRKNVLVIRDFNGVKTYSRVDLTTKEFINSPVYYLTQNDVVYVEPNKSGVSGSVFDGRVSAAISIASLLITSVILLTR